MIPQRFRLRILGISSCAYIYSIFDDFIRVGSLHIAIRIKPVARGLNIVNHAWTFGHCIDFDNSHVNIKIMAHFCYQACGQ